jgi:hypothetical protein
MKYAVPQHSVLPGLLHAVGAGYVWGVMSGVQRGFDSGCAPLREPFRVPTVLLSASCMVPAECCTLFYILWLSYGLCHGLAL